MWAACGVTYLTGTTAGVLSPRQDKFSRDFLVQPTSPAIPVAFPSAKTVLACIDTLVHERPQEELTKVNFVFAAGHC